MLVDYSDDSDSNCSGNCSGDDLNELQNETTSLTSKLKNTKRLPCPWSKDTNENKQFEDKNLHDGRTRSFAHIRGNWTCYAYVEYDEDLSSLVHDLNAMLSPLNFSFTPIDKPHMSLSKPFPVRLHWISSLVNTLSASLSSFKRTSLNIGKLEFYTSEDNTRTFLSLKMMNNDLHLCKYVAQIDSALEEFNLPTYYKDPSFHISIGWTLEDRIKSLDENFILKLQEVVDEYFVNNSEQSIIDVSRILFKAGNKIFDIPLKS